MINRETFIIVCFLIWLFSIYKKQEDKKSSRKDTTLGIMLLSVLSTIYGNYSENTQLLAYTSTLISVYIFWTVFF